jgi:chromosome segregation ATPase
MSMTYADHVYDNGWEKCADDTGKIDYEKLCKVYHEAFENFESEMKAKLQQQAEKIESLEAENNAHKEIEKALLGRIDFVESRLKEAESVIKNWIDWEEIQIKKYGGYVGKEINALIEAGRQYMEKVK